MKILFQIDPITKLNLASDSSIALAKEAIVRDFEVFVTTPNQIELKQSKVFANVKTINFSQNEILTSDYGYQDLNQFDIIFIRQDPPFDINYVTNCHILSCLNHPLFINDPKAIISHSEKIYTHKFAEFMPKTLISANSDNLMHFLKHHNKAVIKPINLCGGNGVELLNYQDNDALNKILALIETVKTPIIIQEFLSEVAKGDTRVLICCGEIIGQVLRIPETNSIKANFCAGGSESEAILSQKQQEISEIIAKDCYENKLYFVGLDFIGDKLTEINVTSPTGIINASRQMQKNLSKDIWDKIIVCFNSKLTN
ncbi:MAG: glutathione synthase [Rickettsiales bacterium]|nr:glutathione synthase [Rickettsiales bacterium]